MTLIMGLDPSTTKTGYGIISDLNGQMTHFASGVIKPKRTLSMPRRIMWIYEALLPILTEFDISRVAIEGGYVGVQRSQTAMALAMSRAACMIGAMSAGLEVSTYAPTEVKASVAHGGATKSQVAWMVYVLLGEPEILVGVSEDQTDALAVAICHVNAMKAQEQSSCT